jgi:hypothetical protein
LQEDWQILGLYQTKLEKEWVQLALALALLVLVVAVVLVLPPVQKLHVE